MLLRKCYFHYQDPTILPNWNLLDGHVCKSINVNVLFTAGIFIVMLVLEFIISENDQIQNAGDRHPEERGLSWFFVRLFVKDGQDHIDYNGLCQGSGEL